VKLRMVLGKIAGTLATTEANIRGTLCTPPPKKKILVRVGHNFFGD